ncbi:MULTISPECIES: BON domain-containing protein [unclassified Rhizobium]|uniref:BON domain-containing protein n=1 Tax=unclassified Rhizobium TaxID=2613769 RepID=UPI00160C04FB|nr:MULTISPECIES: BON domain-containing protein [unclassified Rhizobium]MBB3285233.1 osmotically-inducible protein OsmY [Rhizobium sp. BK252]MBB3399972.1 osmotically-inducible protein OsmY [Rhizobium sp. BK289]MBB3412552.1 osmotically-inducible protein OsmY [Rhizobium sp. BK284]MBB3480438.1 osmotically-inducible protein OsmY [Rhizobium sp. BK347]MDK4719111.1 BON domain-containing protein [Rhizobium sp. CNPSo 3968]
MLFLAKLSSLTTSPDRSAICAAIRCLIAYAKGLEDCRIEVVAEEGAIVLSGVAPSDQARQQAIAIAGDYAGTRIINNIVIHADRGPSIETGISSSNSPAPSGPPAALKPPKETS